MGHGSRVMLVMGQLCDGSHGSRVTKDDNFHLWSPWSLSTFVVHIDFQVGSGPHVRQR